MDLSLEQERALLCEMGTFVMEHTDWRHEEPVEDKIIYDDLIALLAEHGLKIVRA